MYTKQQAFCIWLICLCLAIVGCGTSPEPAPTIVPTEPLIQQSITPAVTLPPTATATSITNMPVPPAPIRTPFERRPLPATWTPTYTATITHTPTPTHTPTITQTPTITPTRTADQICEAFRAVPLYDPDITYLPEDELPFIFNADDPTMTIVFEATERRTGEVVTFYLPIEGQVATIGYVPLDVFPVVGIYDWVFYLQTADEQAICHWRGNFTIRQTSLLDLIRTAQPTNIPNN